MNNYAMELKLKQVCYCSVLNAGTIDTVVVIPCDTMNHTTKIMEQENTNDKKHKII